MQYSLLKMTLEVSKALVFRISSIYIRSIAMIRTVESSKTYRSSLMVHFAYQIEVSSLRHGPNRNYFDETWLLSMIFIARNGKNPDSIGARFLVLCAPSFSQTIEVNTKFIFMGRKCWMLSKRMTADQYRRIPILVLSPKTGNFSAFFDIFIFCRFW